MKVRGLLFSGAVSGFTEGVVEPFHVRFGPKADVGASSNPNIIFGAIECELDHRRAGLGGAMKRGVIPTSGGI